MNTLSTDTENVTLERHISLSSRGEATGCRNEVARTRSMDMHEKGFKVITNDAYRQYLKNW